jgi:hypothetical protein
MEVSYLRPPWLSGRYHRRFEPFELEAVGEWGYKGPVKPAELSPAWAGAYYLEGNVVPGGELSPVAYGDFSHCTVRARPGRLSALSVSMVNRFCMVLFYGHARRLTGENGFSDPGSGPRPRGPTRAASRALGPPAPRGSR